MTKVDIDYRSTIRYILEEGITKPDRTDVGENVSVFGLSHKYRIDKTDRGYEVPFLQVRKFAPRIAFEELMWMIRGDTDAGSLQEKRIYIWDGNTSADYLNSIGKSHIPVGTIGKGYGHQFRNFNGVDQLVEVFESLKNNPNGRRHHISLWNPSDFPDMALEPCHYGYTFYHVDGRLSLQQTMRSSDWVFGFPYNIAFASMFLIFMAEALGYEPSEVFWVGTDVHIYKNQIKLANKVVDHDYGWSLGQPKINVKKKLTSLEDILTLEWTDIEVLDFTTGPEFEKVQMAK